MTNSEEIFEMDEPVEKLAEHIVEKLQIVVFDKLDEVWENGISDSWVEKEIKDYVRLYHDTEPSEELLEQIWETINWKEVENLEMEALELKKEWEQEKGPFGNTGLKQSDFI